MSETKRPPRPRLGERLVAAMQHTQEWAANEVPGRVTLYENGERIEPAMMTRQEVEAWQTAHLPKETYTLIQELTFWAGRSTVTEEEAEKVHALRHRAEALLQERQTAVI